MAIALIKYDNNGKLAHAKNRIVALGNLDPNSWSKNECFAPVLSQMELRFSGSFGSTKEKNPKNR